MDRSGKHSVVPAYMKEPARRLVIAARAMLSAENDPAAGDAGLRIRGHHRLFAQLLEESAGAQAEDWKINQGYREDAILITCDPDRWQEGIQLAIDMIEQSAQDDATPTAVSLVTGDTFINEDRRQEAPDWWTPVTDVAGVGVARALSLVRDFAEAGQVLLCGSLITAFDEDPPAIHRDGKPLKGLQLRHRVRRPVLPFEQDPVSVAELTWAGVKPKPVVNRRRLARELRQLQPLVIGLHQYLDDVDRGLAESLGGASIDVKLLDRLERQIKDNTAARLRELHQCLDDTIDSRASRRLKADIELIGTTQERAITALRDLRVAVGGPKQPVAASEADEEVIRESAKKAKKGKKRSKKQDEAPDVQLLREQFQTAWQDMREAPRIADAQIISMIGKELV